MGLLGEFQEFALKGNVLDMAVGIVLGVAFGNVVTSFVNDLLSPPLGLLIGGQDLTELFLVLKGGSYATLAQARADGAVVLAYGSFLATVLQFLLVAAALFLFVRTVNRWRAEDPDPAGEQAEA
ncbi:MAG: large conductance mechanosensitive channel protein MscL [Candidatus Thermoplasmatota archaeon]|nr:large conductance mechanosensitive channel protein MscL [Candidatus Thermoplasmatota archaeon]